MLDLLQELRGHIITVLPVATGQQLSGVPNHPHVLQGRGSISLNDVASEQWKGGRHCNLGVACGGIMTTTVHFVVTMC